MNWKAVKAATDDAVALRQTIVVDIVNGSVKGRPVGVKFIKRMGYFCLGMQPPSDRGNLSKPFWVRCPKITSITPS